ncbi:carboxypeptidase regulatory-like domain-containing protein [Engelhardtia mirabilis]|uniref:Cna protein B-type domain protein n=1 Tax=Engelhardtia mirabilis TaxID=2528011 RepID=A0A518BDM8_9BACT|nr:hypothetical protein Pla133_01480 [Planctomycetes bacterium Pla133]QDU99411.1 hypothetical protein Pla86_01480 [Planctomycetes bacterium Pla86]
MTANDKPLQLISAVALAFGLATPAASADVVTGRVVDQNGVPIPDVNIDIDNIGSGGDPTITDDITDAAGNFAIVVPPGLYDVLFFPPKPPVTTFLNGTVPSVPVVGTVNLGDVVLTQGIGIQGRVLSPAGLPLPALDLDIMDAITGQDLLLIGDNTDAFGQFVLAAPAGPFELEVDATGVVGQVLVSYGALYDLGVNTNLGDITLEPGALITGKVVGPGGAAVSGADIDLFRSDGTKVVTPKDNTNGLGNFSVTAPFDVVDLTVCPALGQALAGKLVPAIGVVGPTAIGTVPLAAGVTLSGNVTTFDGSPAAGADVDLIDTVTGLSIFLCGDSVQANGSYSFKAPQGVYDVVFEPSNFEVPLGADVVAGVGLFGAQVVNGVLPDCPFPLEFGAGTPGSGGLVPDLVAFGGAPRADNSDFGFALNDLAGGSLGALAIGFQQVALPLFGGTLYVNPGGPLVSVPYFAGGAPGVPGAGAASFPVPVQASYAGIFVVAQAYVVDLGVPGFLALSDAVSTTFCP